jgi:hypothetical protein
MTCKAIGIAMAIIISSKGCIHKAVAGIVHVDIIDTRHRVDDIERTLKRAFVVSQH